MSISHPDSERPRRVPTPVDLLDDGWDVDSERATIVPAEPPEEYARKAEQNARTTPNQPAAKKQAPAAAITTPPPRRHDSDLDMTPMPQGRAHWSEPDLSQRKTPDSPSSWPLDLDEQEALSAGPSSSPSIETDEIDLGQDMRERFSLGDFSGALVLADAILEADPEHEDAARYAQSCRDVLRQMYIARLGSLHVVPRVIANPSELRWLAIDHRAGFILASVDGISSIEEILDVCGMPSLEALRILYDFAQQRVIGVDG